MTSVITRKSTHPFTNLTIKTKTKVSGFTAGTETVINELLTQLFGEFVSAIDLVEPKLQKLITEPMPGQFTKSRTSMVSGVNDVRVEVQIDVQIDSIVDAERINEIVSFLFEPILSTTMSAIARGGLFTRTDLQRLRSEHLPPLADIVNQLTGLIASAFQTMGSKRTDFGSRPGFGIFDKTFMQNENPDRDLYSRLGDLATRAHRKGAGAHRSGADTSFSTTSGSMSGEDFLERLGDLDRFFAPNLGLVNAMEESPLFERIVGDGFVLEMFEMALPQFKTYGDLKDRRRDSATG